MGKFLFREGEDPRYVYVWTPVLAARRDMHECDSEGHPVEVPEEKSEDEERGITPQVVPGVTSAEPFRELPVAKPEAAEVAEEKGADSGAEELHLIDDPDQKPEQEVLPDPQKFVVHAWQDAVLDRVQGLQAELSLKTVAEIRSYAESHFKTKLRFGQSKLEMIEAVLELERQSGEQG